MQSQAKTRFNYSDFKIFYKVLNLIFKVFIVSILFLLSLRAEYIVELNDAQDVYPINKGLMYFEDSKADLGINDILKDAIKFSKIQKDELNFGFTSSAYWLKIDLLSPPKNSLKQWWIDIDYTLLDDIQIYQKVDKKLSLILHSGDSEKFSQRNISWRTYTAVLDTSMPSTLFVRVKTQSAMQIPINIYSSVEIVRVKQGETLFYGFFYGILLLIIFYNLFLYFVWNDRNYVYYVSFIISFILWQLCIDGLGHQYLWPDILWLSEKGVLIFISLTIFCAILFTRSFLHLSEYAKKLNYTLIILQSLMLALIVSSFIFPYSTVIQVLVWLVFPIPVILLYAGFMALKNKYVYARFYIIGWTLFLGASILLALNTLGYIGGYSYIKYIQQIGAICEVILFSLALAERINLLRQQNISTLSRLNSRLQSEVHAKVSEIREKDELLIQKFRLATMGEMLENISHQWKQPLHKLSLVIQNYYFKSKLEGTNEQDLEYFNEQSNILVSYMSNTMDDFRNFFNPQKEKEYFEVEKAISKVMTITSSSMQDEGIHIDIKAPSTSSIYGYENEFGQVLLNLFSNAKDALILNNIQDKKININVHETQDKVIIDFADNAGGIAKNILDKIFDPYFSTKKFKDGSGIGLYMSKMIIEKSMEGSFSVSNTKTGAEFSIILSKVL